MVSTKSGKSIKHTYAERKFRHTAIYRDDVSSKVLDAHNYPLALQQACLGLILKHKEDTGSKAYISPLFVPMVRNTLCTSLLEEI